MDGINTITRNSLWLTLLLPGYIYVTVIDMIDVLKKWVVNFCYTGQMGLFLDSPNPRFPAESTAQSQAESNRQKNDVQLN